MAEGRIVSFFHGNERRNHHETAQLLGISDDALHNWIRRYSQTAAPDIARMRDQAKRRGTYSKRRYTNDVLGIFLIAYGLNDSGFEASLAISLGLQVFHRLRADIEKQVALGRSENDLREWLENILSVITKFVGRSHRSFQIIDRRTDAEALVRLCSAGTATIIACGPALLALIDRIAAQGDTGPSKDKAA
jgi:hypothetical protein